MKKNHVYHSKQNILGKQNIWVKIEGVWKLSNFPFYPGYLEGDADADTEAQESTAE